MFIRRDTKSSISTMQSIMDESINRTKTRTSATIALLILTPLLFLIVQFCRAPAQESVAIFTTIVNDTNIPSLRDDDIPLQHNNSLIPSQSCQVENFPARHWTRPSPHYAPATNAKRPGMSMYGTLEAQQKIWSHQHPRSCHDKKFLVYEALGPDHGIGSTIHVLGLALHAALSLNRIMVLFPQPNTEWNNGKFCEGMDTIDECYFEPLSSCTISDAFGSMEVSIDNLSKFPEVSADNYRENSERVLRIGIWNLNEPVVPALRFETPVMFHDMLQRAGISKDFYYWWRAQAAAYLVRPTLRTLRELDRRRGSGIFKGQRIEPGTISIHVRHGDKWKESKLAADTAFLRGAETLVERDPERLQRRVFLSTEDPNTVRFFSNLSDWAVQYTNVSRDAFTDPAISPMAYASRIGWDEEFLNSFVSLQLALECDGFVGAISSNWNRLIDELRSTVRCKHDQLFIDVSQGFNITNYDW